MAGGYAAQDQVGQITRRAIRTATLGIDSGDLLGAEPDAPVEIQRLVAGAATVDASETNTPLA
jgi:hypothetical protein